MAKRSIFVGSLALAVGWAARPALADDPPRVAAEATIAVGPPAPTGPGAPPAAATSEEWFRVLFKGEGGVAIVPGQVVGGYARLGADFALTKDPERARFYWGLWDAYEGWFGEGARGFAIPIVFFVGYRAPPFTATLGGGLNLFTVDEVADDTGAGIFSPRGDARLGLDFGGVLVLATTEIQRRWMWGRDDITIVQAGLALGIGPSFQKPQEKRR